MGLSKSSLASKLVFKGGTSLKRCYFEDYRFSEDLDFTLKEGSLPTEDLKVAFDLLFKEVKALSGLTLSFTRLDHDTEKGLTFYISYDGPLLGKDKECKVDITRKEIIVYPTEERAVLRSYPEYANLPEGTKVNTYSLKEVAIEKIAAVTDKARQEPRDLYDLYYLFDGGLVDPSELAAGLEKKLRFETRQRTREKIFEALIGKEARLKSLWKKRLEAQMANLPEFEQVFRAVQRYFRQGGFSL